MRSTKLICERPRWQPTIITGTTSGIEQPFNPVYKRRTRAEMDTKAAASLHSIQYASSGRDVVIALDVRDVGVSGWHNRDEPSLRGTARVMVKDGDFPLPGRDVPLKDGTAGSVITMLLLLALHDARIDAFTDGAPGRSAFFRRMVEAVRDAILYDTAHSPDLVQLRLYVSDAAKQVCDACGTLGLVTKAWTDPYDRWQAKLGKI